MDHPVVLRVMGETLASHLNCVFIDEKDKEVEVVRQCLFRAMISSFKAPRWVFKNFEQGWLEVEENEKNNEDEVPASDNVVSLNSEKTEETEQGGLIGFVKSIFRFVTGLFSVVWTMATTQKSLTSKPSIDEEDDTHDEVKDVLYSVAPPLSHPIFPSVLELLDCDSPWLKQFLVDKAGIDKILVVPKFEEATSHLDGMDPKFTLAGE